MSRRLDVPFEEQARLAADRERARRAAAERRRTGSAKVRDRLDLDSARRLRAAARTTGEEAT